MSKEVLLRKLNQKFMKKSIPVIRTWYTVKVNTKFKEWDKERTQSFEWLVIKCNWKYWDIGFTITVRKISEWIWVEKIFLVHSPNIVSIEIIKIAKIRRWKLYYMRERFWKSARLQEIRITQQQRDEMTKVFEEEKIESVEAVADNQPKADEASQETDSNESTTEDIVDKSPSEIGNSQETDSGKPKEPEDNENAEDEDDGWDEEEAKKKD